MEKFEAVGKRAGDRRRRFLKRAGNHRETIGGIRRCRQIAGIDHLPGAFVHQLKEPGSADADRIGIRVGAEHLHQQHAARLEFIGARGEEGEPVARGLGQDLRQLGRWSIRAI